MEEQQLTEKIKRAENSKENIEARSKYDQKRELNTLIANSDFIIEVIDARDPQGYRSKELENNVTKNKDKRLIIIINKIDLVTK